ncbi:MAG: BON domain-containing protein, partial [Candidatus Hydrogenedentes bacterium]|nr:BON domain-containing protein [Candidatus Hydrogenedentota bacterium]
MKVHRVWFLVTAFLGAFSVPAAAQQLGDAAADAATTARVETTFLLNEHLNPFNINTTTKDGVVTLTGSVADEIQKDLAADLAKSADGVKEVVNNLTVVGTVVSERPTRTWRERINDATLAATVRSNLLYNKELKGLKIGVGAEDGVVTLFGVVNTYFEKDRIEQIVMDTRGVDKVINNLTVHASQDGTPAEVVQKKVADEWVERRVAPAITLNRYITMRNLNVKVVDGRCILTGSVDSPKQRELAESLAMSISGVEKVQNDITIYE